MSASIEDRLGHLAELLAEAEPPALPIPFPSQVPKILREEIHQGEVELMGCLVLMSEGQTMPNEGTQQVQFLSRSAVTTWWAFSREPSWARTHRFI